LLAAIVFMNIFRSLLSFFLDFLETIVMALAFFVVMYVFFFQPHQVKGNSMLPNFQNGEYILTNKITYRFNDPKRGEVVIPKAPGNSNDDYIKRLIGLENDRIKVANGHFYLNGKILDESAYLEQSVITRPGRFMREGEEIIVPENEIFIAGDNREHSSDSREFGTIPEDDIVGKAWFVYWPPDRFGLIEHANLSAPPAPSETLF